jgi:cyclopropane fatty-acyl-phospholipid synthase-like methyltransferase
LVNWVAVIVAAATLAATPGAAPIARPFDMAQGRLRAPDVKFVPTPQSAVDAMLELARVTSTDVVYDLGSGDGRIPITAAKRYGARGVGIEIDTFYLRDAIDNRAKAGVGDRVTFINQDLFVADISPATVVALFLHPRMNLELIPKLKRELRPGTRIVSHQYDMGDQWPPEQTRDVNGLTIYLWTIR